MPIEVQCPCGKSLTVRDELAGRRVKCPVCAEILSVPDGGGSADYFDEDDDAGQSETPSRPRPDRPRRGSSLTVTGKPANANLGTLVPATFGTTTLSLEGDRVVEDTIKPLTRRHVELRLAQVDSVEISTAPNPNLLVLGLLTLPIVVGVLILIAWCFTKIRYLAIRSNSNVLVVCMKGPTDVYEEFMDAVLDAADAAGAKH